MISGVNSVQTIRVWHTESGLCLKCIKVSPTDPVLALHLDKVMMAKY